MLRKPSSKPLHPEHKAALGELEAGGGVHQGNHSNSKTQPCSASTSSASLPHLMPGSLRVKPIPGMNISYFNLFCPTHAILSSI